MRKVYDVGEALLNLEKHLKSAWIDSIDMAHPQRISAGHIEQTSNRMSCPPLEWTVLYHRVSDRYM